MNDMCVLLDNGHGRNTEGKCSPDHSVQEWLVNRELVKRINVGLRSKHVHTFLVCPEDVDISLRERCARVNAKYNEWHGSAFLLSVHCDACANDGLWHTARGFSAHIYTSRPKVSELIALRIIRKVNSVGNVLRGNRAEQLHLSDFAVLRDTLCPAVLTENLFMDNLDDCKYLRSEKGLDTLAKAHVDGIMSYLNSIMCL